MSTDTVYSGTVAAAREASFYGLPAVATSLAQHGRASPASLSAAVDAVCDVVQAVLAALDSEGAAGPCNYPRGLERMSFPRPPPPPAAAAERLRQAFAAGDLLLNVNVPPDFGLAGPRRMATAPLGLWHYSGSLAAAKGPGSIPAAYTIGVGFTSPVPGAGGDVEAVARGRACVSVLQTWPWGHPLALPQTLADGGGDLLAAAHAEGEDGLPLWLRGGEGAAGRAPAAGEAGEIKRAKAGAGA